MVVKWVIWSSTVGKVVVRVSREAFKEVMAPGTEERWCEEAISCLWEREESFWRLRVRLWREAERDEGSVSSIEVSERELRRGR